MWTYLSKSAFLFLLMLCSSFCKIKVFWGIFLACHFLCVQVVGHLQLHSPPSMFLMLFLSFPLLHVHVHILKGLCCICSQHMVKREYPRCHLKPLWGGGWQKWMSTRAVAFPLSLALVMRCNPLLHSMWWACHYVTLSFSSWQHLPEGVCVIENNILV